MADEMPATVGEAVEAPPGSERAERSGRARRSGRAWRFGLTLAVVLITLFGVPWWTLVAAGARWPAAGSVLGTLAFVGGLAALPLLMVRGHGRRHSDRAARAGDTLLGVIWVLFAWSVIGNLLRPVLQLAGVGDPDRSRIVALLVSAISVVLLAWGYAEAMRVPRTRRLDVTVPRLGAGLDGVRVVLLTDTHYGPIDRAPAGTHGGRCCAGGLPPRIRLGRHRRHRRCLRHRHSRRPLACSSTSGISARPAGRGSGRPGAPGVNVTRR